MKVNKNGIQSVKPGERPNKISKLSNNEYEKYRVYVTMKKVVDGLQQLAVVPLAHKDFKDLKKEGYKVIERWEKQ